MTHRMVNTAGYRARQFFRALFARASAEELRAVAQVLPAESFALFRAMPAQDQRHAVDVYEALRQAGHTNQHLLVAALLHDVGKSAGRLPPWQRAMFVLMSRFTPRLTVLLSQGEPRGWRRLFTTYARHSEVGARWARDAGCSPLTVALIRRHEESLGEHETEEDRLVALLQEADNSH